MLELVGLIFGGVARLTQHYMDLRDKQLERDHEHRMFGVQLELADKRFLHDAELRRMDGPADNADALALAAALEAQAREAAALGGWVAKLSASVRPIVLYWLMALYTLAKVVGLVLLVNGGTTTSEAIVLSYTSFDGATLSSALSFWLADRSLRKR